MYVWRPPVGTASSAFSAPLEPSLYGAPSLSFSVKDAVRVNARGERARVTEHDLDRVADLGADDRTEQPDDIGRSAISRGEHANDASW